MRISNFFSKLTTPKNKCEIRTFQGTTNFFPQFLSTTEDLRVKSILYNSTVSNLATNYGTDNFFHHQTVNSSTNRHQKRYVMIDDLLQIFKIDLTLSAEICAEVGFRKNFFLIPPGYFLTNRRK